LADGISANLHLDSLQSNPAYISSIHAPHAWHKPHLDAEMRRAHILLANYGEGNVLSAVVKSGKIMFLENLSKGFKVLRRFVAIWVSHIETENCYEALARVTIVDGQMKVILDEYVSPQDKLVDLRTDETGLTKYDLETYGKPFEQVRAAVREALGDKIIVGHTLSEVWVALRFNPRTHLNNPMVDIAHNNLINFHIMVINNFRHKGKVNLNSMAYLLLNAEATVQACSSKDNAMTVMRIFHFLFAKKREIRDTYRNRAVEIGSKNFSKANKFVDEERDIKNEQRALHTYSEQSFSKIGFDEANLPMWARKALGQAQR